ncbi:hypothetical protein B0H19DRAFT_1225533 [Mycena capillaripes]|nr:hypothetical protein B0H19DRAFT_1225533 [Mycena capillaripes]
MLAVPALWFKVPALLRVYVQFRIRSGAAYAAEGRDSNSSSELKKLGTMTGDARGLLLLGVTEPPGQFGLVRHTRDGGYHSSSRAWEVSGWRRRTEEPIREQNLIMRCIGACSGIAKALEDRGIVGNAQESYLITGTVDEGASTSSLPLRQLLGL